MVDTRLIHLSTPTEHTAAGANPDINHGPWVIMPCPCRFNVDVGEDARGEESMGTLYIPLNSATNLKLL